MNATTEETRHYYEINLKRAKEDVAHWSKVLRAFRKKYGRAKKYCKCGTVLKRGTCYNEKCKHSWQARRKADGLPI